MQTIIPCLVFPLINLPHITFQTNTALAKTKLSLHHEIYKPSPSTFRIYIATAMSYPRQSQVTTSFLTAAEDGDLQYLMSVADRLECGKGLAEVYLRIRDKYGRTALHLAAREGRTRVCKYLIQKLKLDVNLKNYEGVTPLHEAIIREQLPTAVFLIDNGASLSFVSNKGFTALHFAAQTGRKEFLRLLISKGAEVDAPSDSGTPLQFAASRGNKEAVKFLLDKKANPNVVLHNLFTPLTSSILAKSFECMTLLLKAGADPNLASCMQKPLQTAVTEVEIEMIKFLLKSGANPNAVNDEGLTPLETAALLVNHEVMQILFPVTSCIPTIKDWSHRGIIEHVHSHESKKQREAMKKETFLHAKSEGEASFKKKEYHNAIFWYTRAIYTNPINARVLANRSLCWARLNEGELALSDAEAAIQLDPNWAKAHYRAGVAYKMVENYPMATKCFSDALKLDPENKEIRLAFEQADFHL